MANHPRIVLGRWLEDHVFSVDELADAMGVRPKTVYAYIESDERDIPAERVVAVSRFAERTKGLTDIADCFHTPEFVSCRVEASTADGRIEDEIADMTDALSLLRQAHNAGDRDAYDRALVEISRVAENARAEGLRL